MRVILYLGSVLLLVSALSHRRCEGQDAISSSVGWPRPNKFAVMLDKQHMKSTGLKKKTDESIAHVPYIYDGSNGDQQCKEVNLFLSFDCHFCKESLQALADYLAIKPKVRAKLYFFTQEEADKERIYYLLAAQDDMRLIIELSKVFLYSQVSDLSKDKKFQQILKKYPQLKENYDRNKVMYMFYRNNIQKKFFKLNVDKTPTWVINDMIFIEGPVEDLGEIMKAV